MDPEDLILDDAKRHLVERYIDLFVNWNQRINLSAARTRSAVASHVEDSLHVVPYLRFAGRIIDVGAGGGLPGVLVAICLPGAQVVSLEPVNKKHAFLRTAARELGLGNYEPRCERVEDHAQRDYDAAVSRATWDLRQWLEMGTSLVRSGGVVVGMEAIDQVELTSSEVRYPYSAGDRVRAIVIRSV
jgi:16S rRNA (guanine527-N7)-methyltransferase